MSELPSAYFSSLAILMTLPCSLEVMCCTLKLYQGCKILVIAGLSLFDTALAAVHTHEWCSGTLANG